MLNVSPAPVPAIGPSTIALLASLRKKYKPSASELLKEMVAGLFEQTSAGPETSASGMLIVRFNVTVESQPATF